MELTPESKRLIASMKTANCLPELRKAMLEASSPLAPAVKRAARGLPSTRGSSPRGGSLRRNIADAVKRRTKFVPGGELIVIVVEPHGGKANIARAVEGEIPWNHPTFGNDPRVDQEPMPFFYRTLEKYAPFVEARVLKVLDKFADKIR
jgi:hypothetical protein